MGFDHSRRMAAEALGTGLLVASVVGSGIMADSLTDDAALALFCNTVATGAILAVLVATLGPVSGAHFNPAVSLVLALQRQIGPTAAVGYVASQVVGGIAGCLLAHAMFELAPIDLATTLRGGAGQWLAEAVATFGLVATILAGVRFRPDALAWLIGLYITAAYWFTASTSFANPAVTVARSLSNTFSGIRPVDVPGFVLAQLAGALVAMMFVGWLLSPSGATAELRRRA